jgi:hypothetical protein
MTEAKTTTRRKSAPKASVVECEKCKKKDEALAKLKKLAGVGTGTAWVEVNRIIEEAK